jgi:hypothetical protein
MKIISQIPYGDLNINLMEEGGFVGYSFGYNGRNYGAKVSVTKKRKDLLEAVATLVVNAINSYENLKNDTNQTVGGGVEGDKSTSSDRGEQK